MLAIQGSDSISHNLKRKSNIELLRVISMIMILVLHIRYDGILVVYDRTMGVGSIFTFLFEALSIVGVNVFILISGYFSIRLKFRSVSNLLFQIYFYGILGLLGWMLIHGLLNRGFS